MLNGGCYEHMFECARRVYSTEGLANTLNVCGGGNREPKITERGNEEMAKRLRIRKLTEGECMRLMGFEEKDTESMRDAGLSKSAIYHCAGDSIVSTCLVALFGELLGRDWKSDIEAYADKLAAENGKQLDGR